MTVINVKPFRGLWHKGVGHSHAAEVRIEFGGIQGDDVELEPPEAASESIALRRHRPGSLPLALHGSHSPRDLTACVQMPSA